MGFLIKLNNNRNVNFTSRNNFCYFLSKYANRFSLNLFTSVSLTDVSAALSGDLDSEKLSRLISTAFSNSVKLFVEQLKLNWIARCKSSSEPAAVRSTVGGSTIVLSKYGGELSAKQSGKTPLTMKIEYPSCLIVWQNSVKYNVLIYSGLLFSEFKLNQCVWNRRTQNQWLSILKMYAWTVVGSLFARWARSSVLFSGINSKLNVVNARLMTWMEK